MTGWRVVWWCTLGVCAALGAVASVMMLAPATLVGVALATVAPGFVLGIVTGPRGATAGGGHRSPAPSLGHVVTVLTFVVTGVICVVGLVQLGGPVALLPVTVLAATCTPSLRTLAVLIRHHRAAEDPTHPEASAGRRPHHDTGADTPDEPLPSWWTRPPHTLSDPELCYLWRASYPALYRASTPERRLQLVHTRSALLDELAARHPDGFAHWMQHGARAASNPTPYLSTRTPPPHTTGT